MKKTTLLFMTIWGLTLYCDKGETVNSPETEPDTVSYSIELSANPDTIELSEEAKSDIWATIKKDGSLAPDSTFIVFSASMGTISPDSGYSKNGLVRTTLTPLDTISTGTCIVIANTQGIKDTVKVVYQSVD